MAEKEDGSEKEQPKVISLEEHERVKAGLLADVVKHRTEKGELNKKLLELEVKESTYSINLDDLTDAEKNVFERNRKVIEKESQLKERETFITEKERRGRAKELATEYGVDEAELLTLDTVSEMESLALKRGFETLKKSQGETEETEKKEEKKASRSKFENETPSTSTKSVSDMTSEEFKAYEAGLKRDAEVAYRK